MSEPESSDRVVLWWFLATCLVGLLPLWLPAFGQYFVNEEVPLIKVLRFGTLVFYSYAIAVQVLKEKLGEQRRRWERAGGLYQQHLRDLVEIVLLPVAVALLAVMCFWKILGKEEPSSLVIMLQGVATILAAAYSLTHRLWIRRLKIENARMEAQRTRERSHREESIRDR